jgi:tetratricopeptide (TPR) repeat protein
VAAEPGDARAWRLLAQTLYWMGERARAEAAYASALARHPQDPDIRYDYARMLAETGDRTGARRLLGPLRDVPAWRAEAAALLGTIAYWDGDFAGAARLFDEALRADPSHAETARLRREIPQASAGWLKVGGEYWRDDQPLERGSAIVEAGRFLTPVTPIAARFDGRRFVAGAAGAGNVIWVWSPHVAYEYWDLYYPGDGFVDWAATGVLNFGPIAQWSRWWTFDEIFGSKYERLAAFGRPVMIAEFGSLAVGGDRAGWYRAAMEALPDRYPAVRALLFFEVAGDQTVTYQKVNWTIADDADVLAAVEPLIRRP